LFRALFFGEPKVARVHLTRKAEIMMMSTLLLLSLCQSVQSPPFSWRMPGVDNDTLLLPDPPSAAAEAAYQEQQLMLHVNRLVKTLNEFSASYKAGVLDVKTVQAVQKAMRRLEKSELFKRQTKECPVERRSVGC
jgi:hypothetical protein